MRFAFLFIIILLLSTVSVLGQGVNTQYSSGGNAVMQLEYDRPVVVRNDGLQSHFSHSFESRGAKGEWTMVTCPLPSRDSLPSQSLSALSNVPIFSEAGNPNTPSSVDLSGGCLRIDFSAARGDRFRVGAASTVVEIQNGSAEFLVTPEFNSCTYLSCESNVVLHNKESEEVVLSGADVFGKAEREVRSYLVGERNESYVVQDGNVSHVWSRVRYGVVEDDHVLRIAANDSVTLGLHTVFREPFSQFKYNVSVFYGGEWFEIDPFFNTTGSAFLNGTFDQTFLNASDFVQLNTSFLNGTFTSEVFDAGSLADWQRFTAHTAKSFGAAPVDALLHYNFDFQSGLGENTTFFYDEASDLYHGTCVSCPTQNPDSHVTGGSSVYFDVTFLQQINVSDAARTGLDFGTDNFTITAWMKVNSTGTEKNVFTKGDLGLQHYSFQIHNGAPRLRVRDGATKTVTGTAIDDGEWHFVAARRTDSAGSISVWVDGLLDATGVANNLDLSNDFNPLVGHDKDFNRGFDGLLSTVTVYGKSLSADEMWDAYESGAVALGLDVRSCDDVACSGESFSEFSFNTTRNLGLVDNRYFQYRAFLNSSIFGSTPRLFNTSVEYVLLDVVSPLLQDLGAVPDPVTQGENVVFTVNVTDVGGVDTVLFTVNSTNYTGVNIGGDLYSFTLNSTVLGVQSHLLFSFANDTGGNEGVINTTFSVVAVDVSGPLVVPLPTVPDPVTSGQFVNFSANITDVNPLDVVVIEINGSNFTMVNIGGDIWFNTTNSSVFPVGVNSFTIFANDTSGNEGSDTGSFTVQAGETEDFLQVGECPAGTGGVLLLWLVVLLSLAFITMGFIWKIGFVGFFGALLLLVGTWFVAGCVAFFAYVLALIALVLMIYFVVNNIGFNNEVFK